MINPSSVFVRRQEVETRSIADGAVLVHMKTGQCFRLNRVGAEAWAILASPHSLVEVSETVASRYGLPKSRVEADLDQLLAELRTYDLVDCDRADGG